jgi:nucleotide-binding universal stress UspA family protein
MPTRRRGGRIVVGFDGSEHSYRALHVACTEALLRGASLVVVHAYQYGMFGTDPVGGWSVDALEREAHLTLEHAVRAASDEGVEAEGVAMLESPAKALLREADGADLLVVGSRGRGKVAGALLGSVSTACVHHAPCPVLVVPASTPIEAVAAAARSDRDRSARLGAVR